MKIELIIYYLEQLYKYVYANSPQEKALSEAISILKGLNK